VPLQRDEKMWWQRCSPVALVRGSCSAEMRKTTGGGRCEEGWETACSAGGPVEAGD